MPALYPQIYDHSPNIGFHARQTNTIQDFIIQGNKEHSVTLTNYAYGNLDVEKTWNSSIAKKDKPDSITLYLRKDGKRVIESYDAFGNPIFRKLVLTDKDDWKGRFDKLDPLALGAGLYTLEEDSDIFVPLITNKDGTYRIRIKYADDYRKEGLQSNEGISTRDHFPSHLFKNKDGSYSPIELNLYLDGKKIDTQYFTFEEYEFYNRIFVNFNKAAIFKDINLPLYGTDLRIGSYDVITNEPGLKAYNFYIQKDKNGLYTLYLPRLVIDGVPYSDLFLATTPEANQYGSHATLPLIPKLQDDKDIDITVENYYGPNHQIEILKDWINVGNNLPESITVIVTDKDGNEKEVILTAEGDWTAVLDNLTGTLRNHGYTIKEVQIPNYSGKISTEKSGLKVQGKDKDGKDVTLFYTNDLLKKVLESGNYRYELFEFEENEDEDKKAPEFTQANLDQFIKIEKQKDDSYIIRYAKDLHLTEILSVKVNNTYKPPKRPPKTPPEEPPETPELPPETPPEEPPETPDLPKGPDTTPPHPFVPVRPQVIPPRKPGYAPKTGDPGMGLYLATSVLSLLGLGILRKKKED